MQQPEPDRPAVRIIPPLVFLAGLLAGLGIGRVWPTHVLAPAVAHVLGVVPAMLGLGFGAAAVSRFWLAKTTVLPHHASTALVIRGPYRFTRNPMYLGLALIYAGIAVAAQSVWALLLLPVVLWVIRRFAIGPEEAFLHRRFGDAYAAYQARVRRWL